MIDYDEYDLQHLARRLDTAIQFRNAGVSDYIDITTLNAYFTTKHKHTDPKSCWQDQSTRQHTTYTYYDKGLDKELHTLANDRIFGTENPT